MYPSRGIIIDREKISDLEINITLLDSFLIREFCITVLCQGILGCKEDLVFALIRKILRNTGWEISASFLVSTNVTASRFTEKIGISLAKDLQTVQENHQALGVYTSVMNLCMDLNKSHRGHRLVFSNGVFDLLHVGHLKTLIYAKEKGDLLVVGVNSDHSATRIKRRPVNRQHSRAELVASLKPVDFVIIFDAITPLDIIYALKPSVLVKGADYETSEMIGSTFVKQYGGKVITAPIWPDFSTTKILKVARDRPYELS